MKWHWVIPVIVITLILGFFLPPEDVNAKQDGYVILTPISVGMTPDGVFLNLDTNRAYVPNFSSNTVSVIDTTTNTVIDTIKVGGLPWSIEVNSDTNRVYVVNKRSSSLRN